MDRYVCIHSHFYQPPRENPWLEAVELQDSAYPYHDWNERISAECYAPNALSRILDSNKRILRIVNNYAKISFNFGPTLLSWLAEKAPDVYSAILAADRESQKNFSGHGSALAQAYNHMILPLANRRDKQTQVIWGIRDFERRFGRRPEGMWLPETAVDLETLEILADQGIQFTILAPNQARAVRPLGAEAWQDASGSRIDPSTPYLMDFGNGRKITLFFYDGPISRAVAFESLLDQGESLAGRLLGGLSDSRTWPQLIHIATDGETYGHHRRNADMALAYAIHHIESNHLARLTIYAEFLEKNPPAHEVQIFENTSWSCEHGIERWRSNCGCSSGMQPGWHQDWRAPLRQALDWLRDEMAALYEQAGTGLFLDPWAARDHYIAVILDRSPGSLDAFFAQHGKHALDDSEQKRALKLLEMQRHALLMYTSCGWFFDDLSGIETVQVMQYAGRALQLSQELFGDHLEEQFLAKLEQAKSNLTEQGDGRAIYEKCVKPAMLDLKRVGAHYAVSSLFENYGEEVRTYCYTVRKLDYRLLSSGKARLALGRAVVRSEIDRESQDITFGVLHLGEHQVSGGVRDFRSEEAYASLFSEIGAIFERGDFAELLRIVDREFGTGTYTLRLLFRDEQRRILGLILSSALAEAEAAYRQLFDRYAPLMRFMADLGLPRPKLFQIAAEVTLNAELRLALEARVADSDLIRAKLDEARAVGVPLDYTTLEFALRRSAENIAMECARRPHDLESLSSLDAVLRLARSMPFEVNLWMPENVFFETLRTRSHEYLAKSDAGDEDAKRWYSHFQSLSEQLGIGVD